MGIAESDSVSAIALRQNDPTLSMLALRKELAIARGNLARLKIRGDVERMQTWSAKAGSVAQATAQAAAMALAISGGVQAWRQGRRPDAARSPNWTEALKLLGALVWFMRRERQSTTTLSTTRRP